MPEPGPLGVSEQPASSHKHHPVGPPAAEHRPVHVLLTNGTSGWGLLTATEQGEDLHRQALEVLLIRLADKFGAGFSCGQQFSGAAQV